MYIRLSYKSFALMRATTVHAFLPWHDGYPDAPAPFPTLYFLPGYSASAEELATCLPFRQMSARYGIAVVIPDGENSFYVDHPERASMHGTFVEKELVETTRRLLPLLSTRRADTFIGGISMGGYGAAAHGLAAPQTFSKIAMMSPAIEADGLFRPEDDGKEGAVPSALFETVLGGHARYDQSALNPRFSVKTLKAEGCEIPQLYMCCGEDDALVSGVCDSFRRFLAEEGVPLVFEGGRGGHDLPYWDAHLDSAFRFLRG